MELPDKSFNILETTVTEEDSSAGSNDKPVTKLYECQICFYTTYKKFNYDRHHKRHLWKEEYDVNENIPGVTTGAIGTSTPNKGQASCTGDQLEHSKKMCDQCGKEFKSSFGLKLHRKNIHDKDFKYMCGSCGKGYNQKVQYRCHVATHLNLLLEKCSFCSKSFAGHSSLARHKLICSLNPEVTGTDEIKFTCDVCCKDFKSKDSLNYHKKGKHGPKKYLCQKCGNAYAWRSSLQKHRLICK